MVSLQSALLPEAKRPPCLSFVDTSVVASTATSKKRKQRDGEGDIEDEEEECGIELNFDAAPLPLEWQRCLDIKVRSCVSCPLDRAYILPKLFLFSDVPCFDSRGRSTTTTPGRTRGRPRTRDGRAPPPPPRPRRWKRTRPRITAGRLGWTWTSTWPSSRGAGQRSPSWPARRRRPSSPSRPPRRSHQRPTRRPAWRWSRPCACGATCW